MKKLIAVAAVAALALTGCSSSAQPTGSRSEAPTEVFPSSGATVSLIVPFSAGGTTDITARAFATVLSEELSANVEVMNVPGAGGQLGLTELSAADPDGYTIGFTNLPSVITTYLVADRGATYDRSSFVPIGSLTRSTNYFAVSASSSYETLQDLLDAAGENPGAISVGVAGDDERLGVEAAAASADVEFNLVPFDGGSEKTTALLGNQVDAIIGGGTTVVPGVMNGDFRALGIFGGDQDPFLPDIPTFKSLGIDIDINGYLTVSAPAGTADETVAILGAAVEQAVQDETFQELVRGGFQEPMFLSSAEAAEVWAAQEATFEEQLAG